MCLCRVRVRKLYGSWGWARVSAWVSTDNNICWWWDREMILIFCKTMTSMVGHGDDSHFLQNNVVRLNLINHVLALFHDKFGCNTALRNPVFRWESYNNSVWENVKKYSRLCSKAGTRGWISREAHGLQVAKSCTRTEHASWTVMPPGALQDKNPDWPLS